MSSEYDNINDIYSKEAKCGTIKNHTNDSHKHVKYGLLQTKNNKKLGLLTDTHNLNKEKRNLRVR